MSKKQFKTEVSDLLNLIIHSLYSNKEIFLRELISNASDAIDKLKYLSLVDGPLKGFSFDPVIDITFDSEAKTLTIKDNGIGMDEKDLNDNLGTIASSGTKKFLANLTDDAKKDSNLIGQFGVGFYAAFMVASKVEVISRKAGCDEAFRWESEGKSSYSVEPSERDGQGTTIILHLNEEGEEYAGRYRLESLIKKYSDHVAYPIYLEYDQESYTDEKDSEGNPIKKTEHKREQINSASALWRRNKSDIKDEEYKEFYKNNCFDSEDPLFYLHTHAEGATEYTTLFFIPAKAPFDMNYADYRSGVKLYVKRVYITDDDKELLPTYLRFVRGVIDSEDLPLNVSREILQENRIMSAIRNGSVKKLLSEFKKISENNPELYDKFIREYNRPLKEGLYSDYANRDTLLELVRYKSNEVEGFTSLKAYKERMKEGQKAIYYITGGKESILRNSPLLASYKKKGYEVLIMDDDIDEIVISMVGEYQELPLKAINKSGAMDDIKEEKSEEEKKNDTSLVERFKALLGDRVKDVVASDRLVDTPAVIVMDENDPSWQMQRLMKQMGQGADMPEVKPIFEINPDSELVKKVEGLDDESAKKLASVLLDGAYLAEGIMPTDPAAYTRNVAELLSK
ncbi:MAG: molecular chaperone HtpG [Bullifex sp.]|nr:molecular chaperone HtpG [Spirochaetales bacterium]MDD7535455.1 molecular chaperone HtpG [Spirochaetales bacterium]MDY2815375.1 molecular chaperone HtpG [Bullifex sp.]MDY5776459.1 molecular chaperone HtpG [Bullifex sp.]